MRRVEQLIQQSRSQTENTNVGATDGIGDEEFIQFLNDGQEGLLSKIFQTNARAFTKAVPFDITKDVSSYQLPTDVFINSRIVLVEYTSSGQDKDFYPLRKNLISERRNYTGYPSNYIIQGGKLILSPTPDRSQVGALRVTYDPIFPRVDKRRSIVSAVTITAGVVTALTLDNAYPAFNLTDYNLFDHLSFVDPAGAVKASNLAQYGVDGAGVVLLPGGGHTLIAGETIAIGDYVVLGNYTSTHSRLPDLAEKYLLNYCNMRVFGRDSSSDMADQKMILDDIQNDILTNYQESSGDLDEVPVQDYTYYPEC